MNAASIVANIGSARVERSFGFVDLCGFTDFVDANGDQAAVTELRGLRNTVRDVAPSCGVRVDKWLGDGAMLVGVEMDPLVAALLAIEDRLGEEAALPVRAGAATGRVILLEGDDYVGRTVNLAARLCELAEPGEVLVATEGWPLPSWARCIPRGLVTVKGFVGPVAVAAVEVEPRARLAGGHRPGVSSLLDLIGRSVRGRSHAD
jgi:class 3 adenylate cyclase